MLRCGLGRTCFLTTITCSTSTLASFGNTRSTRPCLPLSRPERTLTWSFRRISTLLFAVSVFIAFQILALQHFRRERYDLQKFLLAQFAGYRPEHAGSHRLTRVVDQ